MTHSAVTLLAVLAILRPADAAVTPDAYRTVAAAHGIPPGVLYTLAQAVTATVLAVDDRRPWPWVIAVDGRTEVYADRRRAARALSRHLSRPWHSLQVGLLQLDMTRYRQPGVLPARLLSPWRNLHEAAIALRRHYRATGDWPLAAACLGTPDPQPPLPLERPDGSRWQRLQPTVRAVSGRHRLSPALVNAVIAAESGFDPHAVSPAGAQGLMQLMPATARRFGVKNPFDPPANVDAGARYLRRLLDTFRSLPLALAAYNAGEQAVRRYGYAIPPYRETRRFVPRVLAFYRYFLVQEVLQ